jgi:hypothetical protein
VKEALKSIFTGILVIMHAVKEALGTGVLVMTLTVTLGGSRVWSLNDVILKTSCS